MHRAYVTSAGRGSYTWACSCGRPGGNYGSRLAAQAAADKHEGKK
ncbi:hypothetical protein [Streptomyces sp. NPDC002265]